MKKNLFYLFVISGIAINFYGDFSIYRQNSLTTETGQWVSRSYEIIQAIDNAKLAVFEYQLNRLSFEELQDSIHLLRDLVKDIPSQTKLTQELMELSALDLQTLQDNPGERLLSQLSAAERTLLEIHSNMAQTTSSDVLDKIIFANVADGVLLFLALTFFVYDRRQSSQMQKAMVATLAHVESVNQSLHRNLALKEAKFRTAVHDLKNPLGSIRGFAELLQDEAGNNKSLLEMSQIIQNISNNTLNLVGSVLDTDEIAESAAKEPVALLDCFQETCFFLEPIAKSKGQKITFSANLPMNQKQKTVLSGSKSLIQDAFYNLIGNALKFSPLNSEITATATTEGESLVFKITDQGPGFAKDDFSKMFQPGSRLSARPSGGETSSGIGLFAAKRNIEMHGGTVSVGNAKERGACATIKFPMAQLQPIGISDFARDQERHPTL